MTGFQNLLVVSPQLANIIDTAAGAYVSRPQVAKKLWIYLKRNNLQDPMNKNFFYPNEPMEEIFGTRRQSCWKMLAKLGDHLMPIRR